MGSNSSRSMPLLWFDPFFAFRPRCLSSGKRRPCMHVFAQTLFVSLLASSSSQKNKRPSVASLTFRRSCTNGGSKESTCSLGVDIGPPTSSRKQNGEADSWANKGVRRVAEEGMGVVVFSWKEILGIGGFWDGICQVEGGSILVCG